MTRSLGLSAMQRPRCTHTAKAHALSPAARRPADLTNDNLCEGVVGCLSDGSVWVDLLQTPRWVLSCVSGGSDVAALATRHASPVARALAR